MAFLFNAFGTIDADYRGEVKVPLINGPRPSWWSPGCGRANGDRAVPTVNIIETETLDEPERAGRHLVRLDFKRRNDVATIGWWRRNPLPATGRAGSNHVPPRSLYVLDGVSNHVIQLRTAFGKGIGNEF